MNRNFYKLKLLLISLIVFALMMTTGVAQKSKKFVLKTDKAESKSMNSNLAAIFQPSKSPLVSFRIQFLTGAVDDPKGKEGLANLTAAMFAGGGSKNLTYDEIVEQFYPMATGFGYQVDKEMTTFIGATHADNLAKYYGLISQMILEPGFHDEDFKRIKQDAINSLKVGLRQSNDEELGKERLYNIIYKNTLTNITP